MHGCLTNTTAIILIADHSKQENRGKLYGISQMICGTGRFIVSFLESPSWLGTSHCHESVRVEHRALPLVSSGSLFEFLPSCHGFCLHHRNRVVSSLIVCLFKQRKGKGKITRVRPSAVFVPLFA